MDTLLPVTLNSQLQTNGRSKKVFMKDERKPAVVKTGDDIDICTISVLAGASALLIVALIVRIRSRRNEKK